MNNNIVSDYTGCRVKRVRPCQLQMIICSICACPEASRQRLLTFAREARIQHTFIVICCVDRWTDDRTDDPPVGISRFEQRRQCTAGVLAVVNKSCFVLFVCVWYVIKERELCFRLVVFLLFCDAQNFYNPPHNLKNTSRKLRSAERRPAAADGPIISVERWA